MTESNRIKKFRLSLAKQIPKFPNNKHSLQILESKGLGNLLIDYANWAIRYVAMRPRFVEIHPTATQDKRWKVLNSEINQFLSKVRNGEDLTPHLSLQPHTQGCTPAASLCGIDTSRWADKDFLLNVMGYHHFHLGLKFERNGHIGRTNNLLFARVNRSKFEVIAIFDHSVFNTNPDGSMSAERTRLWSIFDRLSLLGVPAGSCVVSSLIATSGHPVQIVELAGRYAHFIQNFDRSLDESGAVIKLYEEAGFKSPVKSKLRWHLNWLDLGLLDEPSNHFFVFHRGPN